MPSSFGRKECWDLGCCNTSHDGPMGVAIRCSVEVP